MRNIGTLPTEAQARLFVDYLVAHDIACEADASASGGWVVWVHDERQVEEGEAALERFAADPASAEFAAAKGTAKQRERERQRAEAKSRAKVIDARTALFRAQLGEGGAATYTLMAVSIVASIALMLPDGQGQFVREWLSIARISISGNMMRWTPGLADILHGQVWRLVTPIFLHFGLLHLLFNMMWLKQLGGEIEQRKGTLYLLAMVLATGMVSNLAQYFTSGPGFGGMSGVVYALFGYVWMRVKYDPSSTYYLDRNTVILMIGWFFLCLSGMMGPIANTAHAVGLVAGVVWGGIAVRRVPFTQIRF